MEYISWNMGNKDSLTANLITQFKEFQSDHTGILMFDAE